MNERVKRLADLVLKENKMFSCPDRGIYEMLMAAEECEKLRIIREEYPKVIEIDEESLIVGQYPEAPFWERVKIKVAPELQRAMVEKNKAYENKLYIVGGNHKTANFEYVVTNGIKGLIQQINDQKKKETQDAQKEFLNDLHYAAEAIVAWAQAYGEALRMAVDKTDSQARREELLQMAFICERVPYQPSESFREAIQSYFFAFLLFPDGLGRLDQYLYPYYRADVEKGILTREQALALIEELFIKIFGGLGKEYKWSGNNHCVVAGYTADGECGHNECTSLILEAVTQLPTWRPQVSYRVTSKTTMQQLQEAVEANHKRPDLVMFLNDDVLLNNLMHVGVSHADAINYSASGCNETVLTGCSQVGGLEGLINMMYGLERMMKDTAVLENIRDFDEFYNVYEGYLKENLEVIFNQSVNRDELEAQNPQPMASLLTDGCISSATPLSRGGAKYNFCTWCLTGVINLADSLSIIRQMVFEEKRFTLTELSQFLAANWAGYEKQRAYIRNNGRYFGNDDDYADLMINQIGASVNAIAKGRIPYRGGQYLFGTLTGYELSHMVFGSHSGASPDGRYAKEPFTASVAANPGADKNGMTAYLKSAAKIDGKLLQSSVVVNLQLDRALADSDEKRKRLAALFMTYFKLGGVQLQINYLSADELIRAQQEPEKYRNLRVRVTGFSGFFTEFDTNLQNELIQRSLHTN